MTEHWEKIRKHLEEIDLEDHEQKQMLTMCFFVGGEYDGKYMTEWQVEQNLCNGNGSTTGWHMVITIRVKYWTTPVIWTFLIPLRCQQGGNIFLKLI